MCGRQTGATASNRLISMPPSGEIAMFKDAPKSFYFIYSFIYQYQYQCSHTKYSSNTIALTVCAVLLWDVMQMCFNLCQELIMSDLFCIVSQNHTSSWHNICYGFILKSILFEQLRTFWLLWQYAVSSESTENKDFKLQNKAVI